MCAMQRQNKTTAGFRTPAPCHAAQLTLRRRRRCSARPCCRMRSPARVAPRAGSGARWARSTVFARPGGAAAAALCAAGCGAFRDILPRVAPVCRRSIGGKIRKRFFPVRRVSPGYGPPPWRSYAPRPGECVIELNPGLSFGTEACTPRRADACACWTSLRPRRAVRS